MRNTAYLSIGTNIGEREENLRMAIQLLNQEPSVHVGKISKVYETAPVGYTDQASFLNIAVELKTSLEPLELLSRTANIENEMGRIRLIHWGPRIIDLDIILFFHGEPLPENEVFMEAERLYIPHPRAGERAFVLEPLREIFPALLIKGEPPEALLKKIKDQEIHIHSEIQ